MMNWFGIALWAEGFAERYLKHRGRCVLPRAFIGLAVGHGQAVRIGGDADFDNWTVSVPRGFPAIALNHTVMIEGQRRGEGWAGTADKTGTL